MKKLCSNIDQVLFLLFGEIIETDEDSQETSVHITSQHESQDDMSISIRPSSATIQAKKYKDDSNLQLHTKDQNQINQRVVYLLDFIKQLVDDFAWTERESKTENLETLNCFLVLYYTVPTSFKSKIVANLFSIIERKTETSNHDLLICFILKELVADHNINDFKLTEVNLNYMKLMTRLGQVWVRKSISNKDVFFEATVVAFSLYRLENTINSKGYLSASFWNAEFDEDRTPIAMLKSKRLMERLYFDFFNCL